MPASERTMHELLKLLSKAVSAINLFSGGILAEIIVAHHINAYVLNRRVITCSISSRKTDFKLIPYRELNISGFCIHTTRAVSTQVWI